MNRKKLEKKILKKVYKLETKRTAGYLISRLFLGSLFIFAAAALYLSLLDILNDQKSFALLDFFTEDFEVIQRYFAGNISDFIQELPQPLTLILAVCIIVVLVLMVVFLRNFNKLKNRLVSLYKFYKK